MSVDAERNIPDLHPPAEDEAQRQTGERSHRLPGLDGLRGLAILLVVLLHSQLVHLFPKRIADKLYTFLLPPGSFGVPLFFVISGFLITYLLLQAERKHGHINLRHFWYKRFFRIGPPVLVYLVVIDAILWRWGTPLSWSDIAPILFLYRDSIDGNGLTHHFWSLVIECKFYLFWPVYLMLVPRQWRLGPALFALASFPLVRLTLVNVLSHDAYANLTNALRFDFILAGCIMALSYEGWVDKEWSDQLVIRLRGAGVAMALLSFVLCYVFNDRYLMPGIFTLREQFESEIVTVLGYSSCAFVLASLLLNGGRVPSLINSTPLVWMGIISYSLYIWQQLFLLPPFCFDWLQPVLIRLPLCFLAGWASYRLLERPFNRLRGRLSY